MLTVVLVCAVQYGGIHLETSCCSLIYNYLSEDACFCFIIAVNYFFRSLVRAQISCIWLETEQADDPIDYFPQHRT